MNKTVTPTATSRVLDQDVGCPSCGYNLRGLARDVATCPECGTTTDVAQLMVRRWDRPWYRAPGYTLLCLPAAAGYLSFLGWFLSLFLIEKFLWSLSYAQSAAGWAGVGLLSWCAAMSWVWRRLDGLSSTGYALLVHLPIVGFIGGLIFVLLGAGTLLGVMFDASYVDRDVWNIVVYSLCLVGGIAGIFLARLCERIAAKHCIRLYLRRPTTDD